MSHLKNKGEAEKLKKVFDISSLEEIKNRYARAETLKTNAGIYTSIFYQAPGKYFPKALFLLKCLQKKQGYFMEVTIPSIFLSSLEQYAKIIIDEDPEYIIEQKEILNF